MSKNHPYLNWRIAWAYIKLYRNEGLHGSQVVVRDRTAKYGYWHFRLCCHKSHKLEWHCFRPFHHDGFCIKHNRSCFDKHWD